MRLFPSFCRELSSFPHARSSRGRRHSPMFTDPPSSAGVRGNALRGLRSAPLRHRSSSGRRLRDRSAHHRDFPRADGVSWFPGSGQSKVVCASNQASATCAGVTCFSSANAFSQSTKARLARRFSSVKRGTTFRKSVESKVVFASIVPVRNPLPSGLNGTSPMPNPPASAGSPFPVHATKASTRSGAP